MIKNTILLILLSMAFSYAASYSTKQLHHDMPPPVIMGETLTLEVNHLSASTPVYNAVLYYKMSGESDFHSLKMSRNGYLFLSEIKRELLKPGNVQYYFAFQGTNGQPFYLPNIEAGENPLFLPVLPAKDNEEHAEKNLAELLLLSPEDGETVSAEEFLIALSLFSEEENLANYNFTLLIDGVDVSRLVNRDENIFTFTPGTIRGGIHNAEFKVLNKSGTTLAKKVFTFKVTETFQKREGMRTRTSLFLDNRYQEIAETSQNYFRGGLRFDGEYSDFHFSTRFTVNSEEDDARQPLNYYGVNLSYHFSENARLYVKGGDFSTDYDPVTMWGKRLRGVGAGINLKYFDFDFSYGMSYRAIEGTLNAPATGSTDADISNGTFHRQFMSFRPVFKFGSHVKWGLNLLNSKDDKNSIEYGGDPKESLTAGTTLDMNFDQKRIIIKGSFQASVKNDDASVEVEFDTLAAKFELEGTEKELGEMAADFLESTGLLTISSGLTPIPSLAMRFETSLRYFNHNLNITYKRIDAAYETPGNPYLQKDINGFFINDNASFFENQIYLNLFYKSFDTGISAEKTKTANTQFGGSLSYYPLKRLPSLTLSYNSYSRKNDLGQEDSTNFIVEDNNTQRFGISSTYDLELGSVDHTLSFNFSKNFRDDAIYDQNQSDFSLYTVGLRTRYGIPLSTQINYSQSASLFGADELESKTDIQKIYFKADYRIRKVINNGDIKPFVSVNFQKIENNGATSAIDYNRLNYTAGIYMNMSKIGNFSLRFDYIDLGESANWTDKILYARYDINF
jgi:hypothetical protein